MCVFIATRVIGAHVGAKQRHAVSVAGASKCAIGFAAVVFNGVAVVANLLGSSVDKPITASLLEYAGAFNADVDGVGIAVAVAGDAIGGGVAAHTAAFVRGFRVWIACFEAIALVAVVANVAFGFRAAKLDLRLVVFNLVMNDDRATDQT